MATPNWMKNPKVWKNTGAAVLALAGLAGAGFGAHMLKGKSLEETVSTEEAYKPGKTEDGKFTYTFLTSENQREGYTAKFSDEQAFKRFNDFIAQYTVDHEEELKGRDYLTPAEAWQVVKLIDDKKYAHNIREINNTEMNIVIHNYKETPGKYRITFDTAAPKQPGKEFDLEAEANKEYEKLEADQDRYLAMCREKISTRQERVHKLWNAAEAAYQKDLRSNASYQRAKAEFKHHRR
jgi:hypothetical protein